MTWVKLEARFTEHPKIVGLTAKQLALFIGGLCYCARNLTDGFIPQASLRSLLSEGVVRRPGRVAEDLADAGLWDRQPCGQPCGYLVHDYLDYQLSRAEIERNRVVTGSYPVRKENDTYTRARQGVRQKKIEKRTLTTLGVVNSNGSGSTGELPNSKSHNGREPVVHFDPRSQEFFRVVATRLADADERTAAVLHTFARRGLPEAAFRTAMESLDLRRARSGEPLISEVRYFVSALKSMEQEGQYAR